MSVAVLPPAVRATRSPSLTHSERTASSHGSPATPSQRLALVDAESEAIFPKVRVTASQDSVRQRTLSAFQPARVRLSVTNVLQKPAVLDGLLLYVSWDEFRLLAQVSKESRNILRRPRLKDVVLSHFIPGYRYCLRYADLQAFREVEVGFFHLDLFIASQQVSLHQYPAHALSTLSALWPNPQQAAKTERFITLAQAHSRIILLLQSLIHSSSQPLSEELDDTRLRLRHDVPSTGRELVFPAPLSYFGGDTAANNQDQSTKKKHGRVFSVSAAPSSRSSRVSVDGSLSRNRSRLSVFGGRRVPPPPPSADPLGLKIYAESWRGHRRALAASASASDGEDTLLRRPKRRLASTTESSESSLENSSPSPSPRIAENPYAPPTPSSPHDILMATSRLRAPVLRVFHPCAELDADAIASCEAQLDDAGLWQHLSTGDVVCNLGYLPPEEDRSSSSDTSTDPPDGPGLWLLFDGVQLVSYAPPATLPLVDAHMLPSPMYYVHITPLFANPKFVLTLPPAEPQLSLVHLPTQVRSPHSPNGIARTRKYMWLAHVEARQRPGLGEGWHGEWVLEGEGTKEGRQALLDALRGDAAAEREWKLIVEKSSTSRIWLKMSSPHPPHASRTHQQARWP